jgi:hypothetical protein
MKTYLSSSLKISLLFISILGWYTGKSQTLLDADSNKINRIMASQGAKLQRSYLSEDLILEGVHHEMFFAFPTPVNNGILNETFDLTLDNKCIQYRIMYYGDKWMNKLTDSLNMPSTNLEKVKDSLKWISPNNGYMVWLSKSIIVRGKSDQAMCMLLIRKTNVKMSLNPFKQGALKGIDIVINDASIDKYVGTWVWSDGANSFKINFVKKTHHYGANGNILDMEILTGSYEFYKNGKLITMDSDKGFSGSSGGKTDTVNLFITIKSRKSQVALLAIYLPDHTLKLEVEKNRFEFRNDKNFDLTEPIVLTKQ